MNILNHTVIRADLIYKIVIVFFLSPLYLTLEIHGHGAAQGRGKSSDAATGAGAAPPCHATRAGGTGTCAQGATSSPRAAVPQAARPPRPVVAAAPRQGQGGRAQGQGGHAQGAGGER